MIIQRPDGSDALPKRFRDYMRLLEDRVLSLEKAQPVQEDTAVRIVDHMARSRDEREVHLPSNAEIAFQVGDEWINVHRTDSVHGAALELHGEWNGLAVYPSSSNVVYVSPAYKPDHLIPGKRKK